MYYQKIFKKPPELADSPYNQDYACRKTPFITSYSLEALTFFMIQFHFTDHCAVVIGH